jgi:uncharacterized membrane protein
MRIASLYSMSFLYLGAGIYHFFNPRLYLRIMPPYIPFHSPIVYVSGILEIIFAALLIPETTRSFGAWSIIVFLILVFPANVQMALDFKKRNHRFLWIAYARLPLQFILIWWAWLFTK